MDPATAQALADGYVAYLTTGDAAVFGMFSPEFSDDVSKTRGRPTARPRSTTGAARW